MKLFKPAFLFSFLLISTLGYAAPSMTMEEHIALTPIRPALKTKLQACHSMTMPTLNPDVPGTYDLECNNGRHLVIEVIPTCPSGTYSGYSVQGIGEGKIYVPYCSIFRDGKR